MFRDTATNMRKLKAIADDLHATILRPFYPVSKLYRVVNEDSGLQADFMPVIHGVRSFEGLRAESERQLEDLIRRRLALPLEKRMNFLRRRLPGGGSAL